MKTSLPLRRTRITLYKTTRTVVRESACKQRPVVLLNTSITKLLSTFFHCKYIITLGCRFDMIGI